MTGTATITRLVTQQATISLEGFDTLHEANRIALEASEHVRGWVELDPQVFVKVEVNGRCD